MYFLARLRSQWHQANACIDRDVRALARACIDPCALRLHDRRDRDDRPCMHARYDRVQRALPCHANRQQTQGTIGVWLSFRVTLSSLCSPPPPMDGLCPHAQPRRSMHTALPHRFMGHFRCGLGWLIALACVHARTPAGTTAHRSWFFVKWHHLA